MAGHGFRPGDRVRIVGRNELDVRRGDPGLVGRTGVVVASGGALHRTGALVPVVLDGDPCWPAPCASSFPPDRIEAVGVGS